VISGFRHEVEENCARLCYYATKSGNILPTFRDNLSVPLLKKSITLWDLKFYYISYLSSARFKINPHSCLMEDNIKDGS